MNKKGVKGRILVVDDSPQILDLLRTTLEDEGYNVFVATGGEKALLRVSQSMPDLILLDVVMPDMDGFETCRRLKADEKTRDIPVIFMTGLAETTNKVKGFAFGAVDYVTKPIEISELLARVTMHLSMHSMQEQLRVQNEQLQQEITERTRAEEEISILNTVLEERVKERTAELKEEIEERKQAEEGQRIAHQRVLDIIDFLPDATFVIDNERRVIAWNKAMEELTGIKAEDMIGKGDYEYALPFYSERRPILIDLVWESYGEIEKKYINIERHGNILSGEAYTPSLRGGKVYLYGTATALRDARGEITGAIESIRDISDRKHAEEALHESEDKFRNLAERSFVGIFLLQDGLFKYVNARLAEIFAYSPEEIIDRLTLKDVIFPEDLLMVEENVKKRITGEEKSRHYGYRIRTKNGEIKYAEVYSSQTIYQGKPSVIGTLLDITDRRKTEEELRRLSLAIEQAGEEVVITDPEGMIQYVNPAFEKITGYSRQEAIGQTPRILKSGVHDRAFYENLWDTIKNGNIWTGKITNRRKNGSLIHEDATISPFISASGQLTGYVALKRDITEEMKLHSQLAQAQKMEAIGTIAGGIAHDFNNLLTIISGYATLIQTKMDASDASRVYVDEILAASWRATDLTKGLLAFSRKQPISLVPLDITATIKETEKLLKRLLFEDIEFRTSFTEEDTIVMADNSQIAQILFNLVTNARDAMPHGGKLAIETSLTVIDNIFINTHGFGKPGSYVLINISDTGMGMDEATCGKIFEPFFTTKEVGKGTGLGLAIVYGIVKQHNGYITVESMPDNGTAFHIYLPVVETKIDEALDAATPVQTGNEKILIAEDNAEVRCFMREALQRYGYTIIEAKDGEDAIETFKQHQDIDLIVIDTVMPKKNGREVYDVIHGINPHIKVLFTSGYTKDIILDKGIEEKEFNFIPKPLMINPFLKKVREVLDRV